MPRFKDPRMERAYQYALVSHDILYREQGNAGASHRSAYSLGYRGERNLRIARGTLAYSYYVAGKRNAGLDVKFSVCQ
jgi:hypothetical protein